MMSSTCKYDLFLLKKFIIKLNKHIQQRTFVDARNQATENVTLPLILLIKLYDKPKSIPSFAIFFLFNFKLHFILVNIAVIVLFFVVGSDECVPFFTRTSSAKIYDDPASTVESIL